MLNFDRSVVKHGTQNIQNDCHQWLSDRRIRSGRCSAPDPTGGDYSDPPDPLTGLSGPTSKEKGKGGTW